jgi:Zn-dependent peptidase ImmA (M78 family)
MLHTDHKTRVRQLAASFAHLHPGREPLELADAIKARLEYADLGDKDGMFDPVRNVVFLSKSARPERQRFTMAHEVTHALILGDDDLLSDLHDAYEGDELEENIETLCNVGASEILVPQVQLEPLLARIGHGARAISKISGQFQISRSAACVTLAEHLETSAIVAILRAKGKAVSRPRSGMSAREIGGLTTYEIGQASSKGRLVLEVEFSTRTEHMKYPLVTGTPIPPEHTAFKAYESGLPLKEESFIPFRSGKQMKAVVDAFPEGGVVFVVFTAVQTVKSKPAP